MAISDEAWSVVADPRTRRRLTAFLTWHRRKQVVRLMAIKSLDQAGGLYHAVQDALDAAAPNLALAAQHWVNKGRPGGDEGPAPDDNEAIAVISSSFPALAVCAKAEAASNPRFRGVTLLIGWSGAGRATSVEVKEAALKGGRMHACLRGAFDAIRLPRFGGPTRTIEYPIRLK